MTVAERSIYRSNNTQSTSFLKLRHKIQTQMKKQNISYEDILKEIKEDKNNK